MATDKTTEVTLTVPAECIDLFRHAVLRRMLDLAENPETLAARIDGRLHGNTSAALDRLGLETPKTPWTTQGSEAIRDGLRSFDGWLELLEQTEGEGAVEVRASAVDLGRALVMMGEVVVDYGVTLDEVFPPARAEGERVRLIEAAAWARQARGSLGAGVAA